jgi:hypothetical protein
MAATAVVAQNWRAFEWWCERNEKNPNDRKQVIPLIEPTDRYRVYGRNVGGAVVVGKVDSGTLNVFRNELAKFRINLPGEG